MSEFTDIDVTAIVQVDGDVLLRLSSLTVVEFLYKFGDPSLLLLTSKEVSTDP